MDNIGRKLTINAYRSIRSNTIINKLNHFFFSLIFSCQPHIKGKQKSCTHHLLASHPDSIFKRMDQLLVDLLL